MKSTSCALLALLTSAAAAHPAQITPGDLLVRANPSGNSIAIHSPNGALQARSDGPGTEWRMGAALTYDYGWITLKLDITSVPAG